MRPDQMLALLLALVVVGIESLNVVPHLCRGANDSACSGTYRFFDMFCGSSFGQPPNAMTTHSGPVVICQPPASSCDTQRIWPFVRPLQVPVCVLANEDMRIEVDTGNASTNLVQDANGLWTLLPVRVVAQGPIQREATGPRFQVRCNRPGDIQLGQRFLVNIQQVQWLPGYIGCNAVQECPTCPSSTSCDSGPTASGCCGGGASAPANQKCFCPPGWTNPIGGCNVPCRVGISRCNDLGTCAMGVPTRYGAIEPRPFAGPCLCATSYFGSECTETCAESCRAHGQCIRPFLGLQTVQCLCTAGFGGSNCQYDLQTCGAIGSVCNGRGICVV